LTQAHTVSIHAFREEGDAATESIIRRFNVSIHAFREEGDAGPGPARARRGGFQSTPSGRKATADGRIRRRTDGAFQSTPSGRKATRHSPLYMV